MDVYENVKKSGYELPPSPPKGGTYKPVKQVGNPLCILSQGATKDGQPVVSGKLGSERTIEEGQEAARVCTLNALGVLYEYFGDLNKTESVVKVLAFVVGAPGFNSQPAVVDGASQFLRDIFGDDNGVGTRPAVSVIELLGNISVEIEFIFEIWNRLACIGKEE